MRLFLQNNDGNSNSTGILGSIDESKIYKSNYKCFFEIKRPRQLLMFGKTFLIKDISLNRARVGTLGNDQNINFWYDIWLKGSPLVHKIKPNMESVTDKQATVRDLTLTKTMEYKCAYKHYPRTNY